MNAYEKRDKLLLLNLEGLASDSYSTIVLGYRSILWNRKVLATRTLLADGDISCSLLLGAFQTTGNLTNCAEPAISHIPNQEDFRNP